VICVAESTVYEAAAVPPNVTAVTIVYSVPTIVTTVPPAVGPALGVTLVNGAWQPAVSALAVGAYYFSDGGTRYSPWWAVGLVLATFTLPSVVLRVVSVHLGYRRQEALVGWLAGLDPQTWIRVGRVAGLLGLVAAGLSFLFTAPEPWWILFSVWALAAAATRLGVRGGWVIGSAVGLAAAYEAGRLAMAP